MTPASPTFDDRFGVLAAVAYRVAYRLLGDRSDAEEVAQEALARAAVRWVVDQAGEAGARRTSTASPGPVPAAARSVTAI